MRNPLSSRFGAACLTLLTVAVVSAAGRATTVPFVALPDGGGAAASIDFRAAADDGRPVLDLKREDVTLKLNGKPREIRSLQLVQFGGAPAVTTAPTLPPPFATNTLADAGREFLIAIDDQSIAAGSEQPIRDAVRQIMSSLAPVDRVGLVPVTTTPGLNVAPTQSRDAVAGAVAKMAGHANMAETTGDAQCRTRVALDALKTVFQSTTAGSASTVVFFSSGLTPPSGGATAVLGKRTAMGADTCPAVTTQDFGTTANAALASNANFYVVFITEGRGSAVTTSRTSSGNDMRVGVDTLAGAAGAQTILLSGNTEASMVRVGRDTSAYYVATFEPDASDRSGGSSHVEFHVGRDGVKIHARPELVLAKTSGAAPTPNDMVRVATMYRDLPLHAGAYVSRNPGDNKVKILAMFEPSDPSVKLTSAMVALYEQSSGKMAAKWTADAKDLTGSGGLTALPVPAGVYRMRVAATDASGRAGTVDYNDLRAETVDAAPLKLSGLVLGTADGGFKPCLRFGPSNQTAAGYLEIYGVTKGAAVSAALDIASSVDGPALATTDTDLQPTKTEDMRIAFGGFAIGSLPPGDYVVRAVISVDGKPVGRSMHTLRKVAQ